MTYDQLMTLAEKALCAVETAPEQLPAPLVYVLETTRGNIHTVINDGFQPTLDALAQAKDTAVEKVLALWKDSTVDVPSYAFRKALLALDAANAQARILLLTEGGYTVKPMAVTM